MLVESRWTRFAREIMAYAAGDMALIEEIIVKLSEAEAPAQEADP